MPIDDTLNAFVDHGRIELQTRQDGPLAGLTFAVKDFFDVAGVPTGAGSPEWLATHPVPTVSTPIYDRLLDAGAKMVGKTHTDELAWSLNGENAHYGTPVNPAAPGRIPGGSSSGSAAATAGGLVDFAIGSDTGGSVRLPASYCGIYGIRTTHGRIPLTGAVPLAPSYDTAGWFARSPQIMAEVGKVLLDNARPARRPTKLLIARDLFAAVDVSVSQALQPALDHLIKLVGTSEDVDVAAGEYPAWRNVFRVIQSEEAWAAQGEWIEKVKPKLGPGVKERFAAAAVMDPKEIAEAKALREKIVARMLSLMTEDTVLIVPTSPGIAPLRNTPADQLDVFRARAIELLCLAGHAGLPQISLPVATLDDCPLGLSIIGGRNCDEDILQLAVEMGKA
ncbi:amidase [Nitrobacteraceae bacterium AZCC 2161]